MQKFVDDSGFTYAEISDEGLVSIYYPVQSQMTLVDFKIRMKWLQKVAKVKLPKKAPKKLKISECRCGGEGLSDHTCPYAEEMHGNYDTICNCCESCMYQCAMDI